MNISKGSENLKNGKKVKKAVTQLAKILLGLRIPSFPNINVFIPFQ
jgi:hypothetical protein